MLKMGSIHYRMAATMMAAAAPAILTAPVGRGAPPVKVTGATGMELDGLTLVKVVGAGGGGGGAAEVTGAGGGGGALVTGTGGGGGGAVVCGTGTLLQSSQ